MRSLGVRVRVRNIKEILSYGSYYGYGYGDYGFGGGVGDGGGGGFGHKNKKEAGLIELKETK